jgi:hypothetical protein
VSTAAQEVSTSERESKGEGVCMRTTCMGTLALSSHSKNPISNLVQFEPGAGCSVDVGSGSGGGSSGGGSVEVEDPNIGWVMDGDANSFAG